MNIFAVKLCTQIFATQCGNILTEASGMMYTESSFEFNS